MNISPINYTNQKQYKPTFGSFNKSVLAKALELTQGTPRAVFVYATGASKESGMYVSDFNIINRNTCCLPSSAFRNIPTDQAVGIINGLSFGTIQARRAGNNVATRELMILGFDKDGRCTTHKFEFVDIPNA